MDEKEEKLTQASEDSLTPARSLPPTATEPPRLERGDVPALILALALSALWFYVFSFENLLRVPAWGTTAFVLSALGAEAIYLRGSLRPTRSGVFLTVSTVLLAVAPAIFPDRALRMLDLMALSLLTPASALALAGRDFPAMSANLIPETLRLFIPNLFRHIPVPFRSLRRKGRSFNGFWTVVLTLVVLLPVLMVIISLLSSADEIFSSVLGSAGDAILDALTHADTLWLILRVLVFALMLFSFLYSLSRPVEPRKALSVDVSPLPPLPFIAGVSALDLIYAVFAAIQIVFLFGGAHTALMKGGYAQYARSGFFELVAVSAINLTAAFICAKCGSRSRILRALVYVLIALTLVILASALTRMCLYIGVYGMSLLRAGTLLIMAWLAAALLAAVYKTAKPTAKIFPALFALALAGLLVFNYVNIDARIAEYNYRAYKSGRIADYDYSYLLSLGPAEDTHLPLPCRPLIPNSPPKP